MDKGMAEYTIAGIGGNGNQGPEPGHGKFAGYVASNAPSRFTPEKPALDLDFSKIAAMQREHEERLAQMESGGSYWS